MQYDKEIEITEKQYKKCLSELDGVVAHRVNNGKYFIKIWLMKYKKEVERVLAAC